MQTWLGFYSQQIRLSCAVMDAVIDINSAYMEGMKRYTHCCLEVADSTCRVLSPLDLLNQRPLFAKRTPPREASWTDFYGKRTGDINPERV